MIGTKAKPAQVTVLGITSKLKAFGNGTSQDCAYSGDLQQAHDQPPDNTDQETQKTNKRFADPTIPPPIARDSPSTEADFSVRPMGSFRTVVLMP